MDSSRQHARIRLLEHCSRRLASSVPQTDAQSDQGISYAITLIKCDTEIAISPLTRGFLWLLDLHAPGLAYNHILHDLRKRPLGAHAEEAWSTMSDNYGARITRPKTDNLSIVATFSRNILTTWGVREALLTQQGKPVGPIPYVVSDIRIKYAMMKEKYPALNNGGRVDGQGARSSPPPAEMNGCGIGDQSAMQSLDFDVNGQALMNLEMHELWDPVDWNLMQTGW